MKRILSLALASALLLSGCAGPACTAERVPTDNGNGGQAAKMNYVLSEPIYPDFPQQPQMPVEGDTMDWEAYSEAYDKYMDALTALRGEGSGVTEAEHAALNAFAARSIPLALAGREGENAIYSPLSLWSALAMLAQCADGESRRQVLDAMGAEGVDSLQETVSHVWTSLYTDDGLSSLILGNSIWLNSSMQGTYNQETLDILARKYFAGTYSVPMGTEDADRAVTDWVSKQTNGLIGSDGLAARTMPETLTLLVSSLYYRAAWQDEFSAERTEEDIFTDAAGMERKADFMHKTQDASFIRRDGYQAARLATRLGEMVFVLPDEGISPESLLQDPEFFSRLEFHGDAAIWGEVRWSVPKFDVSSDLNLTQMLKNLGITHLLDSGKADLSALTGLDAFLSEAKQLARVKVDEEGVEAAAVTILDVATSAMPLPPEEICVMDLNRPFLFVIRTQDVPLFVGIVNQVH